MSEYARVEIAHPELKGLADSIDDAPGDRYARTKAKLDSEGQDRYMKRYREVSADDPIQIGWDANEAEFHAKTKIFSVLADAMEEELGKEAGRAAVARRADPHSRLFPLVPLPALAARLPPVQGLAGAGVVFLRLQLRAVERAGMLVGLAQFVNGNHHILPRIPPLLKPAAHKQRI